MYTDVNNENLQRVLNSLMRFDSLSQIDRGHVIHIATSLLNQGWTPQEAARMVRLSEHYDETLPEDYACRRMRDLRLEVEDRLRSQS